MIKGKMGKLKGFFFTPNVDRVDHGNRGGNASKYQVRCRFCNLMSFKIDAS
jgi:hypothetical protein